MTDALQFIADNALPLTALSAMAGLLVGWFWP